MIKEYYKYLKIDVVVGYEKCQKNVLYPLLKTTKTELSYIELKG